MVYRSAAQRRGCGALVALCTAAIPAAANAQNAPLDRIEAIERQIRRAHRKDIPDMIDPFELI